MSDQNNDSIIAKISGREAVEDQENSGERSSKEFGLLLEQYIQDLSEKELKAYQIAKSHLGSSFSLVKSKGFIDWKKKHEENAATT